jgi:uncharacterized membrane protein YhiD involved in acid resistance
MATVLTLIVLAVLRPVEGLLFPRQRPHALHVRVDQAEVGSVLTRLREICVREHISVGMLQVRESRHGEVIEARCRIGEQVDIGRVLAEIRSLPGVHAARFDLAASLAGRHPNK